MNKKWTESEKQLVMSHYNSMTDKEICQLIAQNGGNHTLDSVRKFRQRLMLKKAKGRPVKIKKDTSNVVNAQALVKPAKEQIDPEWNKVIDELKKEEKNHENKKD